MRIDILPSFIVICRSDSFINGIAHRTSQPSCHHFGHHVVLASSVPNPLSQRTIIFHCFYVHSQCPSCSSFALFGSCIAKCHLCPLKLTPVLPHLSQLLPQPLDVRIRILFSDHLHRLSRPPLPLLNMPLRVPSLKSAPLQLIVVFILTCVPENLAHPF